MDLPKVEGTQIRGKVYHLNLRIKPEIQDLYGGKSHLRGSLRTSDPKVAMREVRKHKAELLAKEQERARQAEVEDIVSQLTPEQRRSYDEAGGLEGLLEDYERAHGKEGAEEPEPGDVISRDANAGDVPGKDAGGDSEPETDASPADDSPHEADEDGATTEDETYDEDGPVFTIADVLEEYIVQTDADGADSLRQCVRLFTEHTGTVPFEDLTVDHLHEFAVAAKGLPADMSARLGDGTYVGELPFAEMVAWTNASDAKHISETMRFRFVAILKELMDYGVPLHRRGDPWSEYRLQIVKREPRMKADERPKPMFSPGEWRSNTLMVRLAEIAILVFVAFVLVLLWIG